MTGDAAGRSPETWAIQVVRDNSADLLRYLTRRTSPTTDAADVLGNALVVIWNRRTRLPPDAEEARMWCFGVARNALRDYRRHGARRVALVDALRANLDRFALEQLGDPHEMADRNRRNEEIRSAVARLPRRDRELVMLVHWDGFSLTQAAALLAINPSTARTRYARARQRLAYDLSEYREGHDHASRKHSTRFRRPAEGQAD